ncbi:MAG: (Fe-S)-binding protein [Flavobacteriales bacterium]|nr:(Fe-S)-binding protein [Flavobacteriales bacterium]
MISQIAFAVILLAGIILFTLRIRTIRRNILLGRDTDRSDNKAQRWKTMALVALGQSKMVTRPIAGFLHILVYVGFVIINIEVVEIIIDGAFGTHRVLSFLGGFYDILIGSFEILALLVLVACVIFLIRRNIMRIRRFHLKEMTAWPKTDANLILIWECLLMFAFLSMDYADLQLQQMGADHYHTAGSFPIAQHLDFIWGGITSEAGLIMLERGMWWFHIVGILAFLVYITYSKHLHIVLAFPNTYYSNLQPKGRMTNMEAVTNEVKLMMDPAADPYAAPPAAEEGAAPQRFGAKDVTDLTWKQLLDSYTCTECGRCSSVCPANQTGKLLSPRKIVMDTRDRLQEVGKNIDKGVEDDGKSLLRDYITEEELWACTTCNACTEACPVNIDPLSTILDLRRFLIMEESKSPDSITAMFNNVENNGAPWAFSAMERENWRNEE